MQLRAYAKINLTLEVLGRRNDGYHEVATIMQNVGLYDTLHIQPSAGLTLACSEANLEGEDNLVWRAARRLQEVTGTGHGAHIRLEKRIPEAMGLGGGSSDAAAALVGLTKVWELQVSGMELSSIAAGLGSDVPFFLSGGTVKAEGRGEQVSPLPPVTPRCVLLVCPDVALVGKTGRLYGSLSPDSYSDGSVVRAAVQAIEAGQFPSGFLQNTFDDVACQVYDVLDWAMETMRDAGASEVHLCGSGPGLYSVFESETEGEQAKKHLQDEGWRTYLVSTIEKGWELICQG